MDDLTLQEAVGRLVDRELITRLFHAYAWHFDRNEPESIAALFIDDAIIDYGPEFPRIRGRKEIVESIRPGLDTVFAATSHHISNVSISLGGPDEATGTAYVHAWHRYHDGSPDGFLWGQYHDRFRRTPDGWLIAELVLRIAGTRDFHRSRVHPIGRRG